MNILILLCTVDFGVSAQLDKTIGRRNTFIGTPYWYHVLFLYLLAIRCSYVILITADILVTFLDIIHNDS